MDKTETVATIIEKILIIDTRGSLQLVHKYKTMLRTKRIYVKFVHIAFLDKNN